MTLKFVLKEQTFFGTLDAYRLKTYYSLLQSLKSYQNLSKDIKDLFLIHKSQKANYILGVHYRKLI